MRTVATSLLLAASLSTTASAQEINLASLDEQPNRLSISTGAEYGFVAGVGYSRILPFLDRHLVLTGEATLPWASIDVMDYRVRTSALVPIVGTTHWKLAGALAPTLRSLESNVYSMTDLGVDASLVGGYYARRWYVALENGVDFALSTHVTHGDEYRMNIHMDAKDGWYSNPGANIRSGLQAGVAFDRYDIILRAGRVIDSNGEAPLIPFYGTLTVDARW
jgi:hypothetical protein